MKRQKLKLEELKVKSFVTDINGSKMKTIEGGATPLTTAAPATGAGTAAGTAAVATATPEIIGATGASIVAASIYSFAQLTLLIGCETEGVDCDLPDGNADCTYMAPKSCVEPIGLSEMAPHLCASPCF